MKERENNNFYIVVVVIFIIAGILTAYINNYKEKTKNDEYIDLLYNEEYQLIVDGAEVEISNMSREDVLDIINQINYIVEIKDGLKQIQVNEFVLSDEEKIQAEKYRKKTTTIAAFVGLIISLVGVFIGTLIKISSLDEMDRSRASAVLVISLIFTIVFGVLILFIL